MAEWLTSLQAVLKLNPKRRFGPRERWRMLKGSNATVLTSLGQIDVLQRLPGFRIGRSWSTRPRSSDGRLVVNRRTLIELKRRPGSKLDLADIEAIELLPDL